MATHPATRDVVFVDDGRDDFWWTAKGQALRWGIFAGIFFASVLYIILGYIHAKRRIRKGLPPLAYHRWLLSRQQRAIHEPRFRNPMPYYTTYRPQQYGMESFPPPMYDPNSAPPNYQPPAGGSKVDPSQWRTEPTRRPATPGEPAPDYSGPPGPPPAAHLQPTGTGSSGTSNNPYRL